MTLRQVKAVYCVAVIIIAVILVSHGGILEWAASITMLAGALPVFTIIRRAAEQESLEDADTVLTAELNHRRDRRRQPRAYGG